MNSSSLSFISFLYPRSKARYLLTGHLPARVNTAAAASRLDSGRVNRFPAQLVQSARSLRNAERVVIVVIAAVESVLDFGFGGL